MNRLYNPKLTGNAKKLRKNMTKEERHLWYDFLKQLPVTVHRQKTIGNYIVDFYIAEAKLVIELDGSQHFEEEGQKKDESRDVFFEVPGFDHSSVCQFRYQSEFSGCLPGYLGASIS